MDKFPNKPGANQTGSVGDNKPFWWWKTQRENRHRRRSPNVPATPTALEASALTETSFTAHWESAARASSYRLDVSTVSNFATFVTGYHDKHVGNGTSAAVTGLSAGTFYYRVRAVNGVGTSGASGSIDVTLAASWPAGADGALVVNGVTTNIAPGEKDYSSISVINGGVLNITGGTPGAWAVIGVSGNLTVDATSKIQYRGLDWAQITYPKTATAPDSTVLSYSVTGGTPGDGGGINEGVAGSPEYSTSAQNGGIGAFGNGGGGASLINQGEDAILNAAGNGGEADSGGTPSPAPGGAGGNTLGEAGAAGIDVLASTPDYSDGSGGGGGFRGGAGGGVYIKVAGTINIAGSIDCSGGNGGAGGKGGDGIDSPGAFGAGGGSGGAGGGGGKIVVRWQTASPGFGGAPESFLNVAEGQNGNAGAGGLARHPVGGPQDPDPGNPTPPRVYMDGLPGSDPLSDPVAGSVDATSY